MIQPLIFHSDRGIQYACDEFRQELGVYPPIRQSMSRKANCWDNAVAESFIKTLKVECVYDYKFVNQQEAANIVFEYIERGRPRGLVQPEKASSPGDPVLPGPPNPSTNGATFKSVLISCVIYCPEFCCKSKLHLHHFISVSDWDARGVMGQEAAETEKTFSSREQPKGLLLDESGWLKKGEKECRRCQTVPVKNILLL